MSFITNETKAGTPVRFGDTTLVPFANSIRLSVPFIHGGLTWNRPVAISVQTSQGQEYILPVQDVTRHIIFALIGASLISSVLILAFSRKLSRG